MQRKVRRRVVALAVSAAWAGLSGVSAAPAFAPDRPVRFDAGSVGNLRQTLKLVHETTGADFVILGGEGAYPDVDVNFNTVTPKQAISRVAAAAHAAVVTCAPDTFLFQPQNGKRLFVPKPGYRWHKVVPPQRVPAEMPGAMSWVAWDKGFPDEEILHDDNLTDDLPRVTPAKLLPGVADVFVLPHGEALVVYATEQGFQRFQASQKKTDLRRVTYAVSILTARTADIARCGTIPKIITTEAMLAIYKRLDPDHAYYDEDGTLNGGLYTAGKGDDTDDETTLGATPDDLAISLDLLTNAVGDDDLSLSVQARLSRYSDVRQKDGSFPPSVLLSQVSKTETLTYGQILVVRGLVAPASQDGSVGERQTLLFIRVMYTPKHPQTYVRPQY